MAAPTNAALVKKVLANWEPSTHGPHRQMLRRNRTSAFGARAEVAVRCHRLRRLRMTRFEHPILFDPLPHERGNNLFPVDRTDRWLRLNGEFIASDLKSALLFCSAP